MNWRDHHWQLIHAGWQEPALHVALDEVLTQDVAAGRRPPTLRVWDWASVAVVIGSFQSLRNEVDTASAARHGISVVRRISGGGAMFVEPDSTITYSLHAPILLVDGLSFVDSYAFLDDRVLTALTDLGIDARYEPVNGIASPAGKSAGAHSAARPTGPATRSSTRWSRRSGNTSGLADDQLRPAELHAAEQLAADVFDTAEWITRSRSSGPSTRAAR